MHFLSTAVLALVVVVSAADASLLVVSSTPADGATSVALSTTITVTFNEPLDTTARFGQDQTPISLGPNESVAIGQFTFSADAMTISFAVTHSTSRLDFALSVLAARARNGELLETAYVANYTTGATPGTAQVRGLVLTPQQNIAGTVVALMTNSPFESSPGNIVRATVIGPLRTDYEITAVRGGTYWPIAVRDNDRDGEIDPSQGDAVYVYDPNHDGMLDSIAIAPGETLTGIDLPQMQLSTPELARTWLDSAIAIANGVQPDVQLKSIVSISPDVISGGRSSAWVYFFYSPARNKPVRVIFAPQGVIIDSMETPIDVARMHTLPALFIDSNVPIAIAEQNGGTVFRAAHDSVTVQLVGGNFKEHYPIDTNRYIWLAVYEAIQGGVTVARYITIVDMLTAEVLRSVTLAVRDERSALAGLAIARVQPNPASDHVSIALEAQVPQLITVTVIDQLGRSHGIARQEDMGAGTTNFDIDVSGLAAGIYTIRVAGRSGLVEHRVVVAR